MELFLLFHSHFLPIIYRHLRVDECLGVGEGQCWAAMKWLSAVFHGTRHPCEGRQEWETYFPLI